MHDEPITRRARLAEIIDLRHAVLRPGMEPEAAVFDGDDAADTLHFGMFLGDTCIACLSLMRRDLDDGEPAYQLRGMAGAPAHRRRGHGRALLNFAERYVVERTPVRQLWCNARLGAVDFYRRAGWDVVSDVFDIPTVGPHKRLRRSLEA